MPLTYKKTKNGQKPVYHEPTNQAERLLDAERSIRNLESTLRVPHNRGGEYGRNCYASLQRWTEVATDARAKIAAGQTALHEISAATAASIDSINSAVKSAKQVQTQWLKSIGHTWASARALPKNEQVDLQTKWTAFLASKPENTD